jgi:hypothetical protein
MQRSAEGELTAPDWKQEIGRRLANLKLEPTREAAIIEEMARRVATYRAAGKDLIVRIVKSRAGDIYPGKNLILIIAAIPVPK